MRATSLVFLLLATIGPMGCSGDDSAKDLTDDTNEPTDTNGTDTNVTTDPTPGALGDQLTLGKISVYQGVETVLWADGAEPTRPQAPVLAERDATVRVFLRPEASFAAGEVTVALTVGGQPAGEVTQALSAASTDADLGSTFNFELDAADLALGTEMQLRITAAGADGTLTWDSAVDMAEGLGVQETDDITVVIIPVQYDFDGSGRLPDTSQATLDALRDTMYALYPARSVTVRLGDVLPWDRNMGGVTAVLNWQRLVGDIADMRGANAEDPNTYYYGMFLPAEDFKDYCAAGCLLGLASPAFNPTNPSLRSAIGVAFPEVAATTMAHELGHAHGRFHAPCGGAAGTDPQYPYPGAKIGSWGYDLFAGELKDPGEYTDVMGYCEPMWVSDYTYFGLWERIALISTEPVGARLAARPVTKLLTDGRGHTEVAGTIRVADPAAGGVQVQVDLFDAAGLPAGRVPGWFFGYDHVPGGLVTLERSLPAGWTAEVVDAPAGELHLYRP